MVGYTINKRKYEEISTRLFEYIFARQGWDDTMIRWMFVLIGRLFYKVTERHGWQVIFFLRGDAGTGKTTVIKIIQMMYDARDIGVLSNGI